MKDNWLNKLMIAAGLFAILIIVGLLTIRNPELRYKLSEKEALFLMVGSNGEISPDRVIEIRKSKNQAYRFVDLRTPYEFIKGHIEGAVNIPLSNLLSQENYDLLKKADDENKTIILYGIDQSQANTPCMLLKQLGLKKVVVLQGGYYGYAGEQSVGSDSLAKKGFDSEIARYNFSEMVNGTANTGKESSQKSVPQKIIIKPKPKSSSPVAGGC